MGVNCSSASLQSCLNCQCCSSLATPMTRGRANSSVMARNSCVSRFRRRSSPKKYVPFWNGIDSAQVERLSGVFRFRNKTETKKKTRQGCSKMALAFAFPDMGERIKPELYSVLIVDDERAIRDGCREVMASLGYKVYTADTVTACLRVLDVTLIDVVLLDLKMPGVSGLDLMRTVKQRNPEITVIILTAYMSAASVVQAMREGAFDYVTKPFDLEELRGLLVRACKHVDLTGQSRRL